MWYLEVLASRDSRCICYLDRRTGKGSQHRPKNAGDGGLMRRFTPVHGLPAPGAELRPLHMLEHWHVKAVVDSKKPEWLSNCPQKGIGYLKGACSGYTPAMLCMEANNPTGGAV